MLDLLLSPPLASQLDVIASPYAISAERRDALYELEVGLAHGLADTKSVHGARQRLGQGAEWCEVAPALISHLSRLHILLTHLSMPSCSSCCTFSSAYQEEERENLAVEVGVCCSLLQGLALLVPGKRGGKAEVEILLALASAPYWTTSSPSTHQGLTLAPAHLISTLNCLLLTHTASHQPFELAGGPAVLQALAESTTGDVENEEQEEATRGAALDWVELWAARATAEQRAKLELDSAAPLRKVSATWERTKRRVSSGSTRSDCSAESCSSYGSLLSKGSTATLAETDIVTPTDTPLLDGNPFEGQPGDAQRPKLRADGASSQRLRYEKPRSAKNEPSVRGSSDKDSLPRFVRRDVRIASGGSLGASKSAKLQPPTDASMEPPRTPRRAQLEVASSELPAFCTPKRVRPATSDVSIQARTPTTDASVQASLGFRKPSAEPTRGRSVMEPPLPGSTLIAISPAVRRAQARSLSPRKPGAERYATTPGASAAQRPAGMPSRSRPVGSVLPGARSFSGADVFGRKATTAEKEKLRSPERRSRHETLGDPSTTPRASRAARA